jgi:RES domain-containing protein
LRLNVPGLGLLRRIRAEELPNPNWLTPGIPTPGQQRFGWELLQAHGALLVPSVVNRHAWNCLIDAQACRAEDLLLSERFALDPRLARGEALAHPAWVDPGPGRRRRLS